MFIWKVEKLSKTMTQQIKEISKWETSRPKVKNTNLENSYANFNLGLYDGQGEITISNVFKFKLNSNKEFYMISKNLLAFKGNMYTRNFNFGKFDWKKVMEYWNGGGFDWIWRVVTGMDMV